VRLEHLLSRVQFNSAVSLNLNLKNLKEKEVLLQSDSSNMRYGQQSPVAQLVRALH
jgi:outer membrane receptor for ferric coprogen and ferric-rhodotorulic acid